MEQLCEVIPPDVIMKMATGEWSSRQGQILQTTQHLEGCACCQEKLEFFREFHEISEHISRHGAPDLPAQTLKNIDRMSRVIHRKLLFERMKYKAKRYYRRIKNTLSETKGIYTTAMFSTLLLLLMMIASGYVSAASITQFCKELGYLPWKYQHTITEALANCQLSIGNYTQAAF